MAGGLDITIAAVGDAEAIEMLDQLAREFPQEVAGALYRRGESVIADAKENYVPVDDGVLRDSGHVELPQIDGDEISVEIGFGGAAADYAFIQHEGLDFRHTVGEAKYLEKPLLKAVDTMAKDIAEELAPLLRR